MKFFFFGDYCMHQLCYLFDKIFNSKQIKRKMTTFIKAKFKKSDSQY